MVVQIYLETPNYDKQLLGETQQLCMQTDTNTMNVNMLQFG